MARRRRLPDAVEKGRRGEEASQRRRDIRAVRPRLSLQARRYHLQTRVRRGPEIEGIDMTWAGYYAVIVIVLLIAGFRYAGWSSVILISVLALLWIGLSVGISFVSDRRYTRAFNAPVDQASKRVVDLSQL